ncbi:predicted protein [Histoplasma capsulatum G186AR]|uniref:Uncharacterized protein n=1 Tax=Ajellomyces capsulatus (strain G186AR / H82 / ATCC MYA-2454 / RMSCC 2432) TaxID=447093 RepID=C0NYL9_AJECG|nr:uncharacterized protein HCBG_08249 [Histoplasma capsulatum G186AR]EEH03309.1 predicted protein [Histoplasma capsulatum G186AR]
MFAASHTASDKTPRNGGLPITCPQKATKPQGKASVEMINKLSPSGPTGSKKSRGEIELIFTFIESKVAESKVAESKVAASRTFPGLFAFHERASKIRYASRPNHDKDSQMAEVKAARHLTYPAMSGGSSVRADSSIINIKDDSTKDRPCLQFNFTLDSAFMHDWEPEILCYNAGNEIRTLGHHL